MKYAAIFDLDGTLADTMPLHYRAWLLTCERFGLAFPEDEFYALGGVPTEKIVRMVVERSGLSLEPGAVETFKERAVVELLETPGALLPVAPVVAIARELRAHGVPLAIGSGGTRAMVRKTLTQLGLTEWFAAIVSSEDTERHKPEPDVFLEAARRLGVEPAHCTVYEDTDLGLEAARRAGMRGVDIRPLHTPKRLTGDTASR